MRVQIVVCSFFLDPSCDVDADFLIINTLVDWPIANKVLVHFFILLDGAGGLDMEYFVRLIIALLFENCFV